MYFFFREFAYFLDAVCRWTHNTYVVMGGDEANV
jgi:hypothetical protein